MNILEEVLSFKTLLRLLSIPALLPTLEANLANLFLLSGDTLLVLLSEALLLFSSIVCRRLGLAD